MMYLMMYVLLFLVYNQRLKTLEEGSSPSNSNDATFMIDSNVNR